MSIAIKQTALLSAFKKVLPATTKGKALIEGADTFVFDGKGTIRACNDTIAISFLSLALHGLEGAVNAEALFQTISRFTADEVEFKVLPEKWELKAGRSKPKITRFEDRLTPFLEAIDADVSTWKPLPPDFSEALRLCLISGNKVQRRGFYIVGNVLYSTDGQILNRYSFSEDIDDLYLDDPAVVEFLKLGKFTEINLGLGWVHFRGEHDLTFSAKLKDRTDYPIDGIAQYFDVCDNTEATFSAVLPEGLADAADRVRIFGTEDEGVDVIDLTITAESILLESQLVSGSNEEEVPWVTPIDIKAPIEARVDPAFLIHAQTKAPNLSVVQPGETPLLIFSSNKFTQIASTRARRPGA